MNFDRNTVLGIVVLALLFFGYFFYNSKERSAYLKEQARQDSIKNANKPQIDTVAQKKDSVFQDSLRNITAAGNFGGSAQGTEELLTVESNLVTYTFSNKGGQLKKAALRSFKNQLGNPVQLIDSGFDKITYNINTADNKSASVSNLYFSPGAVANNPDGSKTVSFTLHGDSASGQSITHEFVIRPDDYMVDFNVKLDGAERLLSQWTMNMTWQHKADQMEKDVTYEKRNSQIGYKMDGEYDYNTITVKSEKEFDKSLNWVGVKQQFFNTTLVAKNNFSGGKMEWTVPSENTDSVVVQAIANLRLQVPAGSRAEIPFAIYYGPNDYKVLKKYGMGLENLVNLGTGIWSFVKYINRWIILPVFDFLKGLVNSSGIVILLLTVFIRLLTSPLMYPGYKTSAQMKLLRPDLAKLKEKFPEQQQYAMEQMKFMREAGVNQFAGCLPGLLQIPIFFALYSFFNASVALRGESFLWAKDLSAYDSVLNFGFNIPLYGDHVSLFTLTAIITSFFISLYSMSMTPDQSNPIMKYMPYIFPFFLLFIFNSLPSALTWYYTVSNLITLGLQFFIQNYVIDHDKLLAKIEANRKKPKTKSKWQERMEQMQEQQKRVKEMQQRSKK